MAGKRAILDTPCWQRTVAPMRLPLSASLLLLLTACTSAPTSQTTEPEAVDSAVAAALPQGTFTVTGEWRGEESQSISSLEGYVSFGSTADGIDCESEYTLTAGPRGREAGWPAKMRSVRTSGGPGWIRDESNPDNPGRWYDHADPSAPSLPYFIGWDVGSGMIVVADGAGTGALCALPVAARFMRLQNGELTYDQERAQATVAAGHVRWLEKFLDAADVTGSRRSEILNTLTGPDFGVSTPDLSDRRVTIESVNGNIVLTEYWGSGADLDVFTMTFTPTTPRTVERVDAATYFERVAVEIENSNKSGWDYTKDQFGL